MTKRARKTTQVLGDSQLRSIVGGAPTGRYNQPETLASSIQKKESDTDGQVIGKV